MSVYSMLVEDNVRCMGIIRGKPLAGIYIKGGGLADRDKLLLLGRGGGLTGTWTVFRFIMLNIFHNGLIIFLFHVQPNLNSSLLFTKTK